MNDKDKVDSIRKKFIMTLIIITPIIDLINGFFMYELKRDFSPGVIIRSAILVLIIYFYLSKVKNLVKFIIIISLFLFTMLIEGTFINISYMEEIAFVSKIYYNYFLMYVFIEHQKNIDMEEFEKLLIATNIIVSFSLILTKSLGIGVSSYGEAGGYKGLYMGLNDLTGVLILTFPFLTLKLIRAKNKILYSILVIISALNIILVGTKTALIFLIIMFSFLFVQLINKKRKIFIILLILIVAGIFIVIFKKYFWESYSSGILTRLRYYSQQQNYSTFLLSGRNQTLKNAMSYWAKNKLFVVFGMGFSQGALYIQSFLYKHSMIEMDFFDIAYFYGIIFALIVFYPLFKKFITAIKIIIKDKILLNKIIAFSYLIGLIISTLGGHILLSPLAGVYFVTIVAMLEKIS